MTLSLISTQSLVFAPQSNQAPLSEEAAEIRARLHLLVPEKHTAALRELQDYALAYVAQYHANTLALEHEWDFLMATLDHAWRQEQYEVVTRLAADLAYPAGRRQHFAEAKHVLQRGIVASRRIQDRRCFAALLNRLGGLMFTHGAYQRGYRLWQTGLYHIESDGPPPGLWEPLYSFTYIVDLIGNYASAQHFLETFYRASHDDFDGLAVALFARGLYARFMGQMESASTDYSHSLRLLLSQPLSPARQLLLIVVQAELARAQGQYARSQQYTQTALALAQAFGDLHIVATLLIDEGVFARFQGQFDDMQRVFSLLRGIEGQMSFPNIAEVAQIFEQQLLTSGACTSQLQRLLTAPARSPRDYPASLSEREVEVLQLVAEGMTSREIAARLVIAPTTVKKHLEHIYTRLDVHTRTAAIAQARRLNLLA